MTTTIRYHSRLFTIDLSKPRDISIPYRHGGGVNAWGREPTSIKPYVSETFTGSVVDGAAVNFNDMHFNPHAHGTHTECYGHITKEVHSVNQIFPKFFFYTEVITIAPEKYQDDFVISKKQLRYALRNRKREALVIRTLPNTRQKLKKDYTDSNPPYLLEETAAYLAEVGNRTPTHRSTISRSRRRLWGSSGPSGVLEYGREDPEKGKYY